MNRLFTRQEIRATAVFLPLAFLVILAVRLFHPAADPGRAEELNTARAQRDTLRLHEFDPNEVGYEELRRMGWPKHTAVGLIRFRESGKVFRIPEDVALCYHIDDSAYQALKPYIRIGQQYRIRPRRDTFTHRGFAPRKTRPAIPLGRFRMDTVSARYLSATGVLSKRQAEALIRWRDLSGIYDMEELRACYVVSDSAATRMQPHVIFPEPPDRTARHPVEINTADSAALRSVKGIGEKTVMRILAYRQRLGGFARKEQIREVEGVTEQNYELILKQISCNCYVIRKIDINFAPRDELARHPYISPRTLRRLLRKRQLKGGWNSAEELISDDILTKDEAERLAPYVVFGSEAATPQKQHTPSGDHPTESDAPQTQQKIN